MARKVRIRIRCRRRLGLAGLLALALLVALLLSTPAWARQNAANPGAAHDRAVTGALPMFPRGYYLTKGPYNGASADGTDGNGAGVCAEGYHFASLWEILDTSNLRYNTDFGYMRDDSGLGPPSWRPGWVRTGYSSSISDTAGMGNCANWSSSLSSDSGTFVRLHYNWTITPDIGVWDVNSGACNEGTVIRVWCVADEAGFDVYLPLVLREAGG
jgi:hypothetical protein